MWDLYGIMDGYGIHSVSKDGVYHQKDPKGPFE